MFSANHILFTVCNRFKNLGILTTCFIIQASTKALIYIQSRYIQFFRTRLFLSRSLQNTVDNDLIYYISGKIRKYIQLRLYELRVSYKVICRYTQDKYSKQGSSLNFDKFISALLSLEHFPSISMMK